MSTVLTLVALFVIVFAAGAFPLFRPRFKDHTDEGTAELARQVTS